MRNQPKKKPIKENNGIKLRQFTVYDQDFKKAVVSFAEENGTGEAKKRYGVSESCIRRWRKIENKLKQDAEHTHLEHISTKKIEKEAMDDMANKLDSMPLTERLKTTHTEGEPLLQSQPLSPTKLKVTRQSKISTLPKFQSSPQPPPPPVEEISLKWNSYQSNMQSMFPNLLSKEQYVDATLVAEGQSIKCHRVILSSCSPYFEQTLDGVSPFQHPVIFMKDVPFWILKTLCDFMYTGEVQILQTKLHELLAVAKNLKIKGLAEKEDRYKEEIKTESLKPIKQEKTEESFITREREPDKREIKEKKRQPLHSHIPLLKCERLKLIHNSEKSLLKRLKVQFKNSHKKVEASYKNVNKEPLSKADILDPYDLLEPVYEEVQKESKAVPAPKNKENKSLPVRKSVTKKVKKRKISDDRDESPSPILTKKGTRSRPIKKMAKYSDTGTVKISKDVEALESTIVREPHTSQTDPLLALEDIKTEPLDLDDENIIEIEDNVIGFSDNVSLEEEEIMESYDNLLFDDDKNNSKKPNSENLDVSKEPTVIDSPLMDVHSLIEKGESVLKIVDVTKLKNSDQTRHSDFLEEDPLNITHNEESIITITNIQSLVDTKEDSLESMCNEMGFRISEIRSQTKESIGKKTIETTEGILGFEENLEEKMQNIDEDDINESQTGIKDPWNVAESKSTNEDSNNLDGAAKHDDTTTDTNISEVDIGETEKTTDECDRAALENIDKDKISGENEILEINVMEDRTMDDDTDSVDESEPPSLINIVRIESLDTGLHPNEEEPSFDMMNIDGGIITQIDVDIPEDDNENKGADVKLVVIEAGNILDKANELEISGQSRGTIIEGSQLEIEHNLSSEEIGSGTFQYSLCDNSEKSCEMVPEYKFGISSCLSESKSEDGVPKNDNQNESDTLESSCNLNRILDNEETLMSNTDNNFKGCENSSSSRKQYQEQHSKDTDYVKDTRIEDEECCSHNIPTYTSPTFHVAQVVSEEDVNEDAYKYFKDNESGFVESSLNENANPMSSEMDTIVSDLTQIVGESQNRLSESNSDNVQEDIEESLANLLK